MPRHVDFCKFRRTVVEGKTSATDSFGNRKESERKKPGYPPSREPSLPDPKRERNERPQRSIFKMVAAEWLRKMETGVWYQRRDLEKLLEERWRLNGSSYRNAVLYLQDKGLLERQGERSQACYRKVGLITEEERKPEATTLEAPLLEAEKETEEEMHLDQLEDCEKAEEVPCFE